MQMCDTSSENDRIVKRVSVRTGGAGHAHSGVIKKRYSSNGTVAGVTSSEGCNPTNIVLVKLGG